MRILLANEARRGGGGVETYLASLIEPLLRRGHDVALLYANPSAEQGPTSIPAREAWSVADNGLDSAVRAVRAWRPDVCFSHNMRPLDVDDRLTREWPTVKMMHGYFGACVSGQKAFSFPTVAVCRRRCDAGCLAYYVPRRCGQLRPDVMLAQYAWAMRQQRLFRRYAAVVVASDYMRREYLRYGLAEDRVHAIPLFAADDRIPAPAGRPIDILFLGRLTTLKGPRELLRAAGEASVRGAGRPLHVVIAGDGHARDVLAREARALETRGPISVEFAGWVDAQARSALLARTSVLAVPSLWPEPFGLVGLEAGLHGVPAVAFDVGGVREWLEHGVNGLLVKPSVQPLVQQAMFGEALARVLRDSPLRARLSAGARATAARLNVSAHVTELERVLSCRSAGTS